MKEIKAIIESSLVQKVLDALGEIPELPNLILSEVTSYGQSVAGTDSTHGLKQTSLEIVVPSSMAAVVADAIAHASSSDGSCDGRIFVTNIDGAANIRDIEYGVAR